MNLVQDKRLKWKEQETNEVYQNQQTKNKGAENNNQIMNTRSPIDWQQDKSSSYTIKQNTS